jgi:hypothetical protein
MASHLIEPTKETPSSEQWTDTSGSYDNSDITTDSDIIPGLKETTPVLVEDAFCKTCSAIDFQATRSNMCTCYVKIFGVYTVHDIFTNKSCPSCRLLCHLVKPYPDARPILPGSQVSLWLSPYSLRGRDDKTSIKPKMDQPKITEVRMCTHEVAQKDQKKARRCRMLGTLLPVRKDEPPESNGAQCQDELFSKLEYR